MPPRRRREGRLVGGAWRRRGRGEVLEDRRGDDRRRMPLADEPVHDRQPGPEGVAAKCLPQSFDEPLRTTRSDGRRGWHPLAANPRLERPLDVLELVGGPT